MDQLADYNIFLDKLFQSIRAKGIDLSNYTLDHIAYRTASENDFRSLKSEFTKIGTLVHENYISDNIVQIYRLNSPLIYNNYQIQAIELIGPNAKINYQTGYEHAEFTIHEDFNALADRYPDLDWNKSAMDRPEFPMLKLALDNNMQVKFNHIPVLEMALILPTHNEKN